MFWSLEYDSISSLGLSSQSSIGFDMNFRRLVEHNYRRSRLKGDNQEQRVSNLGRLVLLLPLQHYTKYQ